VRDELLRLLESNAAAGTPCVLATVVRTESPTSAHPGDKAVITADGHLHGWIGGSCAEPLVRREAARALADGLPRLVRIVPSASDVGETRDGVSLTVATTCPSGGALEIFIDPQVPRPLLLVAGDSPAARTLLQLGALVGFRTAAVPAGMTAEALAATAGGGECWVVVATMGHYDEEALEAVLLGLPEADVALVASERRAEAVLDGLRARGLDGAQIARVRTPAGEHRGGTQEGIALHALDGVVARRRERLDAQRAVEGAALDIAAVPAAAAVEITGFAIDPVCGMTVDVADSLHSVEHAGQTFHFCCSGCARRFEADPARFLQTA